MLHQPPGGKDRIVRVDEHRRETVMVLVVSIVALHVGGLIDKNSNKGEGAYLVHTVHRGQGQRQRVAQLHAVQTHAGQGAVLNGNLAGLLRHAPLNETAMQEGCSGFIIITNRYRSIVMYCRNVHMTDGAVQAGGHQCFVRFLAVQPECVLTAEPCVPASLICHEQPVYANAHGCHKKDRQKDADHQCNIGFPVCPQGR